MKSNPQHRVRVLLATIPRAAILVVFLLSAATAAMAQRVAVLTPDPTSISVSFAARLEASLSKDSKLIDRDLSEPAFRASGINAGDAFNLSIEDSRNIGAAIGCDFFILVRAAILQRYSTEKKDYFESYAAVYGVSARTGRLFHWTMESRTAADAETAGTELVEAAPAVAADLLAKFAINARMELGREPAAGFEDVPPEGSPAARGFKPPLPYRRIPPAYTPLADLYGVEATVDILVDIDRNGSIADTEISRWAGFGLDESVENAVRSMNWRPGSRNGKALPVRVLLRYNFRKKPEDRNP